MMDPNSMASLWNWTSPAWLVALAGLGSYLLVFGRPDRSKIWPLMIALTMFGIAFISPVGVLADGYLFSAHLVQHLLLLLVIPMCLLLSLPADRCDSLCRRGPIRRITAIMSFPPLGWLCGLGIMWLWHVPNLCSLSVQSNAVGCLRDVTFVLAGLMFWWPIYAPLRRQRLGPPQAIVYLFSACLGCTLLGIYITFTTISVCPAFSSPVNQLTMLHDFGLTPAVDQQLGGLLMWLPPCMLYIGTIISILRRWYSSCDVVPSQSDISSIGLSARTLDHEHS